MGGGGGVKQNTSPASTTLKEMFLPLSKKLSDLIQDTLLLKETTLSLLAGDQSWPLFITFLYFVTEILCLVIL